jgi:hypothetical protein
LARDLLRDLVYRKKSGFDPPFAGTFGSRPVKEYLNDVVLAADNPLRDFVHADVVAEMVRRIEALSPLDAESYEFLWTLSVASGWLRAMRTSAFRDS